MQAFQLVRRHRRRRARRPPRRTDAKFIAGGTDLMQLMKDNVEAPTRLVDLERAACSRIHGRSASLRLEAHGAHERRRRASRRCVTRWPVICRRRCWPLRRRRCATWPPSAATCCNARAAAISATPASPATSASPAPAVRPSHGENRMLAILGGSDHCIATHPPILPWRWWRWTRSSNCAGRTARGSSADRRLPSAARRYAAYRDGAAARRDDRRGRRAGLSRRRGARII